MNNLETCECEICHRTREYYRFSELLPESKRESFQALYSAMFDELESLTTDREFQKLSKSDQK